MKCLSLQGTWCSHLVESVFSIDKACQRVAVNKELSDASSNTMVQSMRM